MAMLRQMCRNITTVRGLDPSATETEIAAAAEQYVRKVSGVSKVSPATESAFSVAVTAIATATEQLLAGLPPRRTPPKTEPPLRRVHP